MTREEEEKGDDEEDEDDLGTLGILLAMGFDKEHACLAAAKSSSVQVAVERLVMGDHASREKRGPTKKVREMRDNLRTNLLELGFSESDVAEACARCSSIEAAVEFLVAPAASPASRNKLCAPAPAESCALVRKNAGGKEKSDLLHELVALGFPVERARIAAQECSDSVSAIEWFSGNFPDDFPKVTG